MSCKLRVVLLALALAAGCGKRSLEPGITRIAVVPFENLSGDPANDWISGAVADVLVSDLTGLKTVQPVGLRSRTEVPLSGASRVVMGYYSVSNGTIRFHAGLREAVQQKTAGNFAVSGALNGGITSAANALAKSIDTSARPFGTASDEALRAYSVGSRTADPASASQLLEKAVSIDPNFGEGWLMLTEWHVRTGQASEARQALVRARARGTGIRDIERTRMDFLSASLAGDTQATSKALQELSRLIPGDTAVLVAVAQTENNARRFQNAADWFRKAAAAQPANMDLWNQLLYACASAGDYTGVKQAFESYKKAAPDNANAWDSLGEGMYYLGRFNEAEKAFLEANRMDPAFLAGWTMWKAAHARRMQGDQAGAAALFGKFLEERRQARDPLIELYQARWEYVTGKQQDAIQRLSAASRTTAEKSELAAAINAQLAAWKIAGGEMDTARGLATGALSQAGTPNTRLQAFLCLFASQPKASAEEWRARANRALQSPGDAAARDMSVGYALLFNGDYASAASALRSAYSRTAPSVTGEISVPLAWALAESGKRDEAKSLLRYFPVPPSRSDRVFDFLDLQKGPELRRALGL